MEGHQGGHSSFIDTSALVNSRHSQHIIPTADIDSLYARPSNKQNQIGIPLNAPKNVEIPSSRNSQTLKNDMVSCCEEYFWKIKLKLILFSTIMAKVAIWLCFC